MEMSNNLGCDTYLPAIIVKPAKSIRKNERQRRAKHRLREQIRIYAAKLSAMESLERNSESISQIKVQSLLGNEEHSIKQKCSTLTGLSLEQDGLTIAQHNNFDKKLIEEPALKMTVEPSTSRKENSDQNIDLPHLVPNVCILNDTKIPSATLVQTDSIPKIYRSKCKRNHDRERRARNKLYEQLRIYAAKLSAVESLEQNSGNASEMKILSSVENEKHSIKQDSKKAQSESRIESDEIDYQGSKNVTQAISDQRLSETTLMTVECSTSLEKNNDQNAELPNLVPDMLGEAAVSAKSAQVEQSICKYLNIKLSAMKQGYEGLLKKFIEAEASIRARNSEPEIISTNSSVLKPILESAASKDSL